VTFTTIPALMTGAGTASVDLGIVRMNHTTNMPTLAGCGILPRV
jgi:hypothetical protein